MSGRAFKENNTHFEDRERPTYLSTGTPVTYRQEAHERWSMNKLGDRPPGKQH